MSACSPGSQHDSKSSRIIGTSTSPSNVLLAKAREEEQEVGSFSPINLCLYGSRGHDKASRLWDPSVPTQGHTLAAEGWQLAGRSPQRLPPWGPSLFIRPVDFFHSQSAKAQAQSGKRCGAWVAAAVEERQKWG